MLTGESGAGPQPTMLGGRGRPDSRPDAGESAGPLATVLGRRERPEVLEPAVPGATAEIRFGPGVPPLEPAPAGAPAAAVLPAAHARRRRLAWVAGLLVVAVLAAVAWWWLHRPGTLEVRSVRAQTSTPSLGCDGVAELRAVVATDGDPGIVRYRWRRNDGQQTAPLQRVVPADRSSVTLVLHWQVKGVGRFHGVASVVLSAPRTLSATTSFDYSCP